MKLFKLFFTLSFVIAMSSQANHEAPLCYDRYGNVQESSWEDDFEVFGHNNHGGNRHDDDGHGGHDDHGHGDHGHGNKWSFSFDKEKGNSTHQWWLTQHFDRSRSINVSYRGGNKNLIINTVLVYHNGRRTEWHVGAVIPRRGMTLRGKANAKGPHTTVVVPRGADKLRINFKDGSGSFISVNFL